MANYMKCNHIILIKIILILNLILQDNFICGMDLEVCLDQFDIHHNMIIRTEESLAIGGIFLQSTRLDTEIECRRLCCETEKCDVYIFEEKNESYCYVFSCGPPENFKCKFTKHANFTSSVLIPVIRYSTSSTTTTTTIKPTPFQQLKLQSIQPISQQELELTNLKTSKNNQNLIAIKTPTVLPFIKNSLKSTALSVSENCGRFQFKCHSGECIGIYNACNGIPQCEDGSDEGPECTENSIIDNANRKLQNRITNLKQNSAQSNPRQYQPVEISTLNNREDPMSSPPLWINRRPIQDMHPNIGDIQVPSNIPSNMANQPNNAYVPLSNMQNPYILKPADHMMMMPPNMNWDPNALKQLQQIIPINNVPYEDINHLNNENNNEHFIQQQHQPLHQLQSPSAIKITQENLENIPFPQNINPASENSLNTNNQENQKEAILNKQHNGELSDSTETSGEYTAQAAKKISKIQKEQETEKKINAQNDFVETYPFHEEYRMEFKDHDGYSDRPSGAIISLVLGLLVTACLALLIGCKMRTVGRRRVRVKGSFNDADFLVNGMYL